jgi:hypothetical protein
MPYSYQTDVWVQRDDKLIVKVGIKSHNLITANQFAVGFAEMEKEAAEEVGYVTVIDLSDNRQIQKIHFGKTFKATAF